MTSTARIPVFGTFNFRDAGGYPADGGTVRTGKLFRSDSIDKLGTVGRSQLDAIGVRRIIDLRDDFEAQAMPDDIAGLDIDVRRLPLFEGSAAAQGTIGISLAELYARIVTLHAGVVVEALRDLAHSGEDAVLVHCTAGKDRTGIVVALALLAVGVPRQTVLDDYSKSQTNLSGEWLDGMLAFIAGHGVEQTPELRVLLGGSPPDALATTIDLIDRDYGSVREYLIEKGMSERDLVLLRESLVYSIR